MNITKKRAKFSTASEDYRLLRPRTKGPKGRVEVWSMKYKVGVVGS